MFLSDRINKVYTCLKNAEALGAYIIVKAYPFAKLSSRIKDVTLAVSCGGLRVTAVALDDSLFHAESRINVDVFLPAKLGAPDFDDAIYNVLGAVIHTAPKGYELQEVTTVNAIEAYKLRCVLIYDEYIEGGDYNG